MELLGSQFKSFLKSLISDLEKAQESLNDPINQGKYDEQIPHIENAKYELRAALDSFEQNKADIESEHETEQLPPDDIW
jgi:hypothetical protein